MTSSRPHERGHPPRRAKPRRTLFLLSSAVLLTGLGLMSADRVWGFGERSMLQPPAEARALAITSFIAARMAAHPDTPVQEPEKPASKWTRVEVAVPTAHDTLNADLELATSHETFAPLRAGILRFPDGAISTVWNSGPLIGQNRIAPSQGMGRSVVIPQHRKPPKSFRAHGSDRLAGPNGVRSQRFVPASIVPIFTTSRSVARENNGRMVRFARPLTTASILFDGPDNALDAQASMELERLAADLRRTHHRIEVRTHPGLTDAGGHRPALARARAVRAFLVSRGVPLSAIRITQSERQRRANTGHRPFQVDVIYRAG